MSCHNPREIHFYLHNDRKCAWAESKFTVKKIRQVINGKRVMSIKISFMKFSLFIDIGHTNV